MSFILGISAYYHDSSVCLFKDGQLLFACEEEKFTGIKHDSSFPFKSLNYIFKKYKIDKSKIEAVCYYEDPNLKLERVKTNIKKQFFKNPLYCIVEYIKIKKNISELKTNLSKISKNVFYSKHHESHLYYSYYSSDFKDGISLSIDGVGEFDTMCLGLPHNNGLDMVSLSTYPHSIGLFYSAMTSYLGFRPNEGEYKLMGLASYGSPDKYYDVVKKLITYKNTNLKCNLDVFCWDKSNKIMFNEKLVDTLGVEPRLTDEPITKDHEDLASSVQKVYEEVLFDVIKSIGIVEDSPYLALGGGCAYNGAANGKITKNTHIKKLWIPPAPSDAGSAIGACINYLFKNKKFKSRINKNPFIGPLFFTSDATLKEYKKFRFNNEYKLLQFVARKLNDGKVIGWYTGHCEFGARSLGNRSILANPTIDGMKDRINKLIKKREGFRPFAPMVTKEDQNKYFIMEDDIPYMNQVVEVKNEYRDILKAVTHVDGTARVQTVYRNTRVHVLLKEFEKLSGYPILLNTSFNIKDKTMVLTPKNALDTFYDTDIDILIIDNYVIYK
jgi:carbamoyltransferase